MLRINKQTLLTSRMCRKRHDLLVNFERENINQANFHKSYNKRHEYEDNFRRRKHITKHAPLLDRILETRKLEHHNYGQTGHKQKTTRPFV